MCTYQMLHTLLNQVILKITLILEKQSLIFLLLKLLLQPTTIRDARKIFVSKRTTKISVSSNHCLNFPRQLGELHTLNQV